jgi:DNA-binding response OmpR family regulator
MLYREPPSMPPAVPVETEGSSRWFAVHDPNTVLAAAPSPSPPHVLIVEDHVQVRRVVARALRAAGFATFEACDAGEARTLLEVSHVDAVVLDIALPGALNGVQLGRWIRFRNAKVPLIFITGLTEWEIPEPIPNDRLTRFLCKPFGARMIVDYVCNLLAPRFDVGVISSEH